MCLSIPAEIVALGKKKAKVKQADHYHWVDISLINQKIKKGDYLLFYQSVAIEKISSQQAKEILRLTKNVD